MPEPIHIDPMKAFEALQQYHGIEMARLSGDIAAKNAYIEQVSEEMRVLKERITAMEQNQNKEKGDRPGMSGADMSKIERHPSAPNSLRKVVDNPQA